MEYCKNISFRSKRMQNKNSIRLSYAAKSIKKFNVTYTPHTKSMRSIKKYTIYVFVDLYIAHCGNSVNIYFSDFRT